MKIVTDLEIPELKEFKRGKVRNIYDLDDKLLLVATDRISAFDCVLPSGIPGKGMVLNRLSMFWFDYLSDIAGNHFISADTADYPPELGAHLEMLDGRSMLVKKADLIPVECVVRGYLAGSGLKDYKATGSVCGHKLPEGLREGDRLPEVIFTPSTKAETGHDENIGFKEMSSITGRKTAQILRRLSVDLYKKARDYAASRGLIICDTKFEFGRCDGEIILIDEVLTPDSSRFWPEDSYEPGKAQKSFDKQFVREYLEGLDWDKKLPAPELPDRIIRKTSEKYLEALERLTGKQPKVPE